MKFPYIVKENLSTKLQENWRVRFSKDKRGYNRAIRENVWRRHQVEENKELSGWSSKEDMRRRIIHFRDEYALNRGDFVLENPYMFLHLKLPKEEIAEYLDIIEKNLDDGGWIEHDDGFYRGDTVVTVKSYQESDYDISREIECPFNYAYLDVTLKRQGVEISKELKNRAWVALDTGIRKIIPRGNPTICNPEDIIEFLPAQIELGCGASIEANIPALNYLHGVYSIKNSDGNFVLRAEDDAFLDIFRYPEDKFREIAHIHLASLEAEPTIFYKILKEMVDNGQIVEPIITNNFDGLPLSVGVKEFSLREFDATYQYPVINFDKRAKSLIVIGAHADRRNAQRSARLKGLKVIYVDPEGYEVDGKFIPYEVESPQDDDLLIRMKASDFLSKLDLELSTCSQFA